MPPSFLALRAPLAVLASAGAVFTAVALLFEGALPGPVLLRVLSGNSADCEGVLLQLLGGRDADRDRSLSDDETEVVGAVCSAEGGLEIVEEPEQLADGFEASGETRYRPRVLLDLLDEGPGSVCPAGGLRAVLGVDRDGDRVLGAGEKTAERVLCSLPRAPRYAQTH